MAYPEYPHGYTVTIKLVLRFKNKKDVKEVERGVMAAMWGTRVSTNGGAWLTDIKIEAEEIDE